MSGDAVRAALEAAAKQFCICDGECYETRHGMMNGPCEQIAGQAKEAALKFGVSEATIIAIRSGKTWNWLPST